MSANVTAPAAAMPPPSLLPPGLVLHFDNTIGVALLAALFNAILYGMLCLQVYNFFQRFEREGRLMKYSVWVLWFLGTLHLTLIIVNIYGYVVTNFGNVEQLLIMQWSIVASCLSSAVTTILVQGWFAYRVWILSQGNIFLTAPLVVVITLGFAFGFACDIKMFFLPTFAAFSSEKWLYYCEIVLITFADIYIAAALCWYLVMQRNPLHRQTYSMINTLIIYTINTGLLTSVIAVAGVITFAAMPDNFVFVGIYLLESGLYSNSLMASLNARDKFRKEAQAVSVPMTGITSSRGTGTMMSFAPNHGVGSNTVQVSVDTHVDSQRSQHSFSDYKLEAEAV